MDIYAINDLSKLLAENPYPGRGIVIGKSADGKHAAIAYFIMGRSVNSRNRIFEVTEDGIRTKAYDESKLEDPSLIIYHPVRRLGNQLIVTNGDQTDTIRDGLSAGKTFPQSLVSRCFEPDGPNWTPRISGLVNFTEGGFDYSMSILKSADAEGTACNRYTFQYPALTGLGHFIHTYVTDGNPIPTFQGEPERVAIPSDIDELTSGIWASLDENNKISLYVLYTNLEDGTSEYRLINKNA